MQALETATPSPSLAKNIYCWAAVASWASLIFFLSATDPLFILPMSAAPGSDNVLNLVEYGILAVLLYCALRQGSGLRTSFNAFALALIASTAYGATIEFYQVSIPFRSAEGLDLLANTAGSLFALLWWRSTVE